MFVWSKVWQRGKTRGSIAPAYHSQNEGNIVSTIVRHSGDKAYEVVVLRRKPLQEMNDSVTAKTLDDAKKLAEEMAKRLNEDV